MIKEGVHDGRLDATERLGPFLNQVVVQTALQLTAQVVVIEILTDQHQLVFALPWPVAVVDGEAFAG